MAGKFQQSPNKESAKPSRVRGEPQTGAALNHEQARIQTWLKQVRFKKTLFGGVDEADLWKKIAELNTLYEAALSAERARYDALLAQRCGSAVHGEAGDDIYG